MAEVLERVPTIFQVHEEFDMSSAKDFHNEFAGQIYHELKTQLQGTEYVAKFDIFRYLDDWQINSFGDFKNMIQVENFVAGLKRFGAAKRFIKHKLDEFAGMGTASGTYAPDVFVTEKAERHNEFHVPLLVIEILSQHSRENDLHFKPYFYETIGVQEYFIGEAGVETGTLIKGYRRVEERYQPLPLEKEGYFSEVLNFALPREWTF